MTTKNIYEYSHIKERVLEFCKWDKDDKGGARYIIGLNCNPLKNGEREEIIFPEEDHIRVWNGRYRILRSQLDRESILGTLILKYRTSLSTRRKDSQEIFESLEPAYKVVMDLYYKFDIVSLPLMLKEGYLFIAKLPLNTKVKKDLERIGHVADTLVGKYAVSMSKRHRAIPLRQGKTHEGMSRIMEYFAHRILREMRKKISIPAYLFNTSNEGREKDKEAFYIDLNVYGDPLYMRGIDCPFTYVERDGDREEVVLPRDSFTSLDQLLQIRKIPHLLSLYAKDFNTFIPECSFGFRNLIRSYKASKLYQFHKFFDSKDHNSYWDWKNTYDKFPIDSIPPCAGEMLKNPNPSLLNPINIQLITKILTHDKWHPKHIAGLIRSKYERNYGWGYLWFDYDASTRANFAVRLMTGLMADGTDREYNLDCAFQQYRGTCKNKSCTFNLSNYRIASPT